MKKALLLLHATVLVLLLALDQWSKLLVRRYLPGQKKTLVTGVFSLYYHENRGSVWGILQGKQTLFLLISVVLLVLLVFAYRRIPKEKHYMPLLWILVVVAAGALGNTLDRLLFGYVTDFLYFELIDFPIFNIADCYITVSAFLTIMLIFTKYREDDFSFLSLRRKDAKHVDRDTDQN